MKRRLIVTLRAEDSLRDIFDWTFRTFGPAQAERYAAILLETIATLEGDDYRARPMSQLTGNPNDGDLHFLRGGRHFIVVEIDEKTCTVLDVVHQSSDLSKTLRQL